MVSKSSYEQRPSKDEDIVDINISLVGDGKTNNITLYEYDSYNQLTKTITGNKTINYSYDSEGYRIQKTVKSINSETMEVTSQSTRYLYSGDKAILETDGSGNETAVNIYGTTLISRTDNGTKLYYIYNAHGDVTGLADSTGNLTATYRYDAFGNIVAKTGEVKNPFTYAGYRYDEESDLYYLNARYYDAKMARFLTADTYRGQLSDPLSLNLYTYCANNPILYFDPSGHVFTTWDNENVADLEDRRSILTATKEWEEAYLKGDVDGQNRAHAKAEKARNKYRADDEVGSHDGFTYRKKSNEFEDKKEHDRVKNNDIDTILYDSKGFYQRTNTEVSRLNPYGFKKQYVTISSIVSGGIAKYNNDDIENLRTINYLSASSTTPEDDAKVAFERWYDANRGTKTDLTAGSVTYFQNELLKRASKGEEVSRMSIEELNALHNEAFGYEEEALMYLTTLAYVVATKSSNPSKVSNEGTVKTGADNIADGAKLKSYYKQAEKYGTDSIKELSDGRYRFYGKLKPALKEGEMAGARLVREWNPATDVKRTWYETLDHAGNIRQVRPVIGF